MRTGEVGGGEGGADLDQELHHGQMPAAVRERERGE